MSKDLRDSKYSQGEKVFAAPFSFFIAMLENKLFEGIEVSYSLQRFFSKEISTLKTPLHKWICNKDCWLKPGKGI